MPTLEELKSIIEQMPETKFELVRVNLESILNPPRPDPLMEKMQRRAEEFQAELQERLKQVQAGMSPEIPRGFHGCGHASGCSYSWQENRVHVTHKSQLYGGHVIDTVDRMELSEDGTTLIYEQEIYAGGRSVRRKEVFPLTEANKF